MTDDELARHRANLHRHLDEFLDFRKELFLGAKSEEDRSGYARILLVQAAELANLASGDDMVESALRPGDGRETGALDRLSQRLLIASSLFGRSEATDDTGTLVNAWAEVRAIANGDHAKLFSHDVGKRKVPYRVALAKLRAIEWDAYLEAKGEKSFLRHASIALAFGAEWDTISRWRGDIALYLDEGVIDSTLRHAILSAGNGFGLRGRGDQGEALKKDGKDYKRAVGFKVVTSDEN